MDRARLMGDAPGNPVLSQEDLPARGTCPCPVSCIAVCAWSAASAPGPAPRVHPAARALGCPPRCFCDPSLLNVQTMYS